MDAGGGGRGDLRGSASKDKTCWILSRLVDKSLVNVESDAEASRRYRFLETVRQYAREHLLQSGEAERLRDRHLAFFTTWFDAPSPN